MRIEVLILTRGGTLRPAAETLASVERQTVRASVRVVESSRLGTLEPSGASLVAVMQDGDEWRSRDKLARQASWLASHPEAAGCFHAFTRPGPLANGTARAGGSARAGDSDRAAVRPPDRAELYDAEDLWTERTFLSVSTLLFRADRLGGYPEWLGSRVVTPGFALSALLLDGGGLLGYLDVAMAHCPGRTPSASREALERRFVNTRRGFRYEAWLARFLASRDLARARASLENGRRPAARGHFLSALRRDPAEACLRSGWLPLRLAVPVPTAPIRRRKPVPKWRGIS